jgi:NTE family protein
MPSIGLVLSAGGVPARAYHAGTLAALQAVTGWDPRTADLVVGTSAGSATAAWLRAGLSAVDNHARVVDEPLSPAGQALVARLQPGPSEHNRPPRNTPEPPLRSRRPLRPALAARAAVGRAPVVAGYAGVRSRGHWSNREMGHRLDAVTGGRWPTEPTWICAVRVRDGRRVVFGRDDVATPSLGTAVRASCAVPGVVAPVRVGGAEFIDGAAHSSTNADLVAGLAFDLVVVVSSMTAQPGVVRAVSRAPSINWYSRLLRREVDRIRRHGSPVLVIEPSRVDLDTRAGNAHAIAQQAYRSACAALDEPGNRTTRALLEERANDSVASAP